MAKLTGFVYVLLLLTVQPLGTQALVCEIMGAVGGAVLVTVGAPIALGAAGFGAAGIAAGSLAAKAMSVAYTTGVGVGTVAALQSAGAAGVGAATVVAGALVGAGAGSAACGYSCKDEDWDNV
ncbi:hypothetical protein BsWGS_24296 [Bradybaena similaris]